MGGAAGAARHLMQQLVGALGRAQVAALETEIGIHHADQGQHREMMALGDDLGADQQVDLMLAASDASKLFSSKRVR